MALPTGFSQLPSGIVFGSQVPRSVIEDGMGISVEMSPTPLIAAASFAKLGLDIRSYREPLARSVKEVMIPSIARNFDVEGRPDPWIELLPNTIANRRYEGYDSGPILNRSGTLKRAAQQFNIWHIDKERAVVRNLPARAWYGRIHQGGSSFGDEFEIPARPFLVIQSPQDEANIERVFDEWLGERLAINDKGWTLAKGLSAGLTRRSI